MVDKDPKKYWELVNELEEIHTKKTQHEAWINPKEWLSHFKRLMINRNIQLSENQKLIENNLENHKNQTIFQILISE